MNARMAKLVAAACAVSSGALSQTAPAPDEPEQRLLERIVDLRAQAGPTPAELIDPLRALALRYEEGGDHGRAIVAVEEARHVTRVHQGLASADEALLLRQQIRNEKALGDHKRVWDLEQDMVTIARRHHDDVRMGPIFRELGDDRAEVLEQYRSGGFPPEIRLGCYYVGGLRRYDDTRGHVYPGERQSCRSGQRGTVLAVLRQQTLLYYADAIEVILRTGDYSSEELRHLEKQALRVADLDDEIPAGIPPSLRSCPRGSLDEFLALPLLGECLEPVARRGRYAFPNAGSWLSLVRLLAYELRSEAPLSARANALAEIADWHLRLGRGTTHYERAPELALELYEQLHRVLQQAGHGGVLTEQIFAPELPVTLPTYQANPFASAATGRSSRYIDVSFDVTQYGSGKQIAILDTSQGGTRAEERALIRLIENTTFRPRVVDGALAESAPVRLRYPLQR